MAKQVFSPGEKDSRLKFITDEIALDGSNPTPVDFAGYLTKVLGVVVTYKGSAAPGVSPHQLTYNIVGTVVNFYAWKATGVADTTLIAATDTDSFTYVVFGY